MARSGDGEGFRYATIRHTTQEITWWKDFLLSACTMIEFVAVGSVIMLIGRLTLLITTSPATDTWQRPTAFAVLWLLVAIYIRLVRRDLQ